MTEQEKSFIESCVKNNIHGVKRCHQHGVNIFVEGNWAITIAATNGHIELVRWLLENGITHEMAAKARLLSYMCYFQNLVMIDRLISSSDCYKDDPAAFSWTADTGNVYIGEKLLAYLNIAQIWGGFQAASESGRLQFLEFLINNNVQEYDRTYERAVFNAASHGQWKAVEYLIRMSIGTREQLKHFEPHYLNWLNLNRSTPDLFTSQD